MGVILVEKIHKQKMRDVSDVGRWTIGVGNVLEKIAFATGTE